MTLPKPISDFCDALGIPATERSERMEVIANSAFPLEIFCSNSRWFVVGILNELPISPDAPVLETFLERAPSATEIGTTAYEPHRQRLIHWMEIRHEDSRSSALDFLAELKEILRFAATTGVV